MLCRRTNIIKFVTFIIYSCIITSREFKIVACELFSTGVAAPKLYIPLILIINYSDKMNKKGITPVISIVLLLMITIALIGFAFVWFTKIWGVAATSGEIGITDLTSRAQKVIRIDNVQAGTPCVITVRNMGGQSISASEIAVYIGDAKDATGCPVVLANSIETCTLATACISGNVIKVSGPNNIDQFTVP